MGYTERTQVLLTPEQRSRLERIAVRDSRSVGAVIRDAIDAYTAPRTRSKHEAFESLITLGAPAGDWEAMKAEILKGAIG